MPFASKMQRRWMWSNHPEMAKRWEKHTLEGADLPYKVRGGDIEKRIAKATKKKKK